MCELLKLTFSLDFFCYFHLQKKAQKEYKLQRKKQADITVW